MVATGKSPRLGLSTEFTRWKQRLDPKNAASTGMKPVESNGPSLRLVATNYRPTGIKPVVANRRKKCFTASPLRGRGVRGRALTCMSPVQLFVYVSETHLDIEFTIKKPIKTECKPLTPAPTPSTGRGEQDQKMWVKMSARRPCHFRIPRRKIH